MKRWITAAGIPSAATFASTSGETRSRPCQCGTTAESSVSSSASPDSLKDSPVALPGSPVIVPPYLLNIYIALLYKL